MNKTLVSVLVLVVVLVVMTVGAQAQEKVILTINLTGFQNDNGKAKVALYHTEKGYAGKEDAFRTATVKITDKKAVCEINNIPNGTYTVKAFHDANGNGELDKNFVGFPKEAYGVSNNAKSKMGTGKYDEAKFTVDGNKIIDIDIN